jgi:hypothetical protein
MTKDITLNYPLDEMLSEWKKVHSAVDITDEAAATLVAAAWRHRGFEAIASIDETLSALHGVIADSHHPGTVGEDGERTDEGVLHRIARALERLDK